MLVVGLVAARLDNVLGGHEDGVAEAPLDGGDGRVVVLPLTRPLQGLLDRLIFGNPL